MALNRKDSFDSESQLNDNQEKSKDVFTEFEFLEVSNKLSRMTDYELENLFDEMEKDENGRVHAKAFGDALKAVLYSSR